MIKITKEWDEMLKEEFSSPEYLKLREFLKIEYHFELKNHAYK